MATPDSPEEKRTKRWATIATVGIGSLVAYILFRAARPKVEQVIADYKEQKLDDQGTGQGPKRYMPLVIDAANAVNIPPSVLAAIVSRESSWDNSNKYPSNAAKCGTNCITSSVCAVGLTQTKPASYGGPSNTTAQALCEPANSLIEGARFLKSLYSAWASKYPSNSESATWNLAIRSYRHGRGAIQKMIDEGQLDTQGEPLVVRPDGWKITNSNNYVSFVNTKREKWQATGLAGPRRLAPVRSFGMMRVHPRCA